MAKLKDMTTGSEVGCLVSFTLPLLAGNLLQQTYNVADTMIVGNYLGDEMLAAVGTTGSVSYLFFALCLGISVGSGVLISQFFGAKRMESVRKAITASATVILIFAAFVSIVSVVAARSVLTLMNVPDNLIDSSVQYMRVYCAGTVCVAAYNWINSVMRALGDSKTPLIFLGVSTVMNVGLDILFISAFKMGVTGAALATVISQGFSAAGCIFYCFGTNKDIRPKRGERKPEPLLMTKCIRAGLPIAMQNGLISISMVALQRVTNGFGDTVMAAYTVNMRIEQFVHQPFMSLSAALTAFTGQNIGASRQDRAVRGLKTAIKLVFCFGLGMLALLSVIGGLIVGCFVSGSETIAIASKALIITGTCYAPLGVIYSVRGFLNGAGDTGYALVNGLAEVICRIVFSMLLTQIAFISYWGIWITTAITWAATACVSIIRFRGGKWKLKAVTA